MPSQVVSLPQPPPLPISNSHQHFSFSREETTNGISGEGLSNSKANGDSDPLFDALLHGGISRQARDDAARQKRDQEQREKREAALREHKLKDKENQAKEKAEREKAEKAKEDQAKLKAQQEEEARKKAEDEKAKAKAAEEQRAREEAEKAAASNEWSPRYKLAYGRVKTDLGTFRDDLNTVFELLDRALPSIKLDDTWQKVNAYNQSARWYNAALKDRKAKLAVLQNAKGELIEHLDISVEQLEALRPEEKIWLLLEIGLKPEFPHWHQIFHINGHDVALGAPYVMKPPEPTEGSQNEGFQPDQQQSSLTLSHHTKTKPQPTGTIPIPPQGLPRGGPPGWHQPYPLIAEEPTRMDPELLTRQLRVAVGLPAVCLLDVLKGTFTLETLQHGSPGYI